jgi:PAS domain S-box-containing protein
VSIDENTVFRSLFAAYPDALLLVDTAGHIMLANPQAERTLGYTAGELVGLPVDALVPDAIRSRHAAYRDAYARNPHPRPMGTQMELVARRRDGSEVMVEIALSPLQEHGLPYVVAAIREIAAYPRVKQALKRARCAEHIAQMGRLAVDSRDPEVLVRHVPIAAAQALELDSGALYLLEPDGQSFRIAGGIGLGAEQTVPNGPDTLPGRVFSDGRPVMLSDDAGSVLGVPLSDRGRTVGALAVRSRDKQAFGDDDVRFLESLANLVTTVLQRAHSEEALRHAQRLESVGQLTGGIAHDFNNLLTVIQGNLQVLEELPAIAQDEYAQQLLGSAARATRRGAELTAKLLAFSRRQVLQPRRVDMGALLGSLSDMLRRTLDQRIRIEAVVATDCSPCLADPGQLESALLNIAINARDAMPQGGSLSFSARSCNELPAALHGELPGAHAQDYVAIAIRDSGSGMPESVKERAFEPFFTTKEAGRGTGLGLSTVYGFAKQSNGGVTLDSAPGEGTTVTLFIPRMRETAVSSQRGERGPSGVPGGLNVMVVEDEPEVLRVVQAFLSGWGCEVTPCSSAEQALALLQLPATQADLLISDVVLGPGMRGTELATRARALRPELALLLMSGYSSELLDSEKAPTDASPELLRKPFTRDDLAGAIARAMRAH